MSEFKELYKVFRGLWKSQPPAKQAQCTAVEDVWEAGSIYLLSLVWESGFNLQVNKMPSIGQPFRDILLSGLMDASGSSSP